MSILLTIASLSVGTAIGILATDTHLSTKLLSGLGATLRRLADKFDGTDHTKSVSTAKRKSGTIRKATTSKRGK